MDSGRGRGRQKKGPPDWGKFYSNGIPKEVIVIDDDDDDQPAPQPAQQQAYPNRTAISVADGTSRHADKKRKMAPSTAYDPVYAQNTSYSTTQTPYHDSKNHSHSTDRNNSGLTAASSLGSQPSVGQQIDAAAVGQKRKRTRAAVQDEAKRRELDNGDLDPFGLYHPPPNPPIKAKEVYVTVVPDVSRISPPHCVPAINIWQKSRMRDQKVDDDDGHYIVEAEANLTDRCTPHFPPALVVDSDSIYRYNTEVAWPRHFWKSSRSLG
jgi:dual-specificity kinase